MSPADPQTRNNAPMGRISDMKFPAQVPVGSTCTGWPTSVRQVDAGVAVIRNYLALDNYPMPV